MARFNYELNDTQEALVKTLMEMCDLGTKKAVLDNALMLLGWAAKEAQQGLKIAAVDERREVFKEIQIAALMGAAINGQRQKRELVAM